VRIVELERTTSVAPFGVRFWDVVTGRTVSDGLTLVNVETGRSALPNRSGVFVAWNIAGAAERGAGDAGYWASPPGQRSLTFELGDAQERFHTMRFDASAPSRGVFGEDCGSPPAGTVPLFSLPSRPYPPGTAAVRAELIDAITGGPAAHAVLEVSADGIATARGIADERGRVLVLLPYPEPPWHGPSPPAGSRPLSAQTWRVELAVRYSPLSPPEPPDLCAVLAQPHAGPVVDAELAFGRELVLNNPLVIQPA
jgi:hypothetical protein